MEQFQKQFQFWCIQIVSKTFLGQDTKIYPKTVGRMPKIRFSANISFSEHFRAYVAS